MWGSEAGLAACVVLNTSCTWYAFVAKLRQQLLAARAPAAHGAQCTHACSHGAGPLISTLKFTYGDTITIASTAVSFAYSMAARSSARAVSSCCASDTSRISTHMLVSALVTPDPLKDCCSPECNRVHMKPRTHDAIRLQPLEQGSVEAQKRVASVLRKLVEVHEHDRARRALVHPQKRHKFPLFFFLACVRQTTQRPLEEKGRESSCSCSSRKEAFFHSGLLAAYCVTTT